MPDMPETDVSSRLYPGKRMAWEYMEERKSEWLEGNQYGWTIDFDSDSSTIVMQPSKSAEPEDLKLESFMKIVEAYGLGGVQWAVSDEDLTDSGEIDIISGYVSPLMRDYMVEKLTKKP